MTTSGDKRHGDFLARAFEHKGRAEAYRLKAEMTADQAMKAIYTAASLTYEDMAREIEKSSKRIRNIDRAAARVRTKRLARPESEPASDSEEPDNNP
jgi:hypothetical protein